MCDSIEALNVEALALKALSRERKKQKVFLILLLYQVEKLDRFERYQTQYYGMAFQIIVDSGPAI